ncbi:MAG: (Fe-S)-binding protein [Candidatus Helarchaeota archaeon]|nr:(Fe-S)-binding protein [Candidatus Helarchaeota archaeon]
MSGTLKDYYKIIYNCAKCAMCRTISPWEMQSKKYKDICPSGVRFLFEAYFAPGKMEITRSLLDEQIQYSDRLMHIIFACPLCGGCQAQCEEVNIINPLDVLQKLRRKVVNERGPLPVHAKFAQHVAETHNPYNESHEKRLDWLPKNVKINENSKIAYFVGCTSSYRRNEIARATINILEALKVDFNIFHPDEWCCGSPLFMTGQVDEGIKLMKHNLEVLEKNKVETLITSCAGCYRTFKEVYPEYSDEYNFKVLHFTEFLANYFKQGDVKLKKFPKIVTYHDPCHLGRHSKVYDAPREILKKIPGLKLVEMERIKENAWCCGAGGGVSSAYKDFAYWTASKRMEEAKSSGADVLTTACPFCMTNFLEASKALDIPLEVIPLVKILEEVIE